VVKNFKSILKINIYLCMWGRSFGMYHIHAHASACVCVRECESVCVCMCMCVCVQSLTHTCTETTERHNPLCWPSDHAVFDALQGAEVCPLGCQGMLLAHAEPAVSHHPHVPLCRVELHAYQHTVGQKYEYITDWSWIKLFYLYECIQY